MTDPNHFRLNSGERQIGTHVDDIRADHTARYQMVIDRLWNSTSIGADVDHYLYGLDAFCGNGYGTHMLSTRASCVVHGIDASAPAIALADKHYGTERTLFSVKEFPFDLPLETYDFVVSMESIEHVEDSSGLIESLVNAVKPGGYFFASTPNAEVLSLELNPNKFHYRHFTQEELIAEVKRVCPDIELVEYHGQDVYTMDNGKVIGRVPESEMYLRPQYKRGQFHCFTFRKPPILLP